MSRDSKKVSKLKGEPEAAGDPEVEEWVDDILNDLSTRDMSKKEQAVFIIDHLAGQAKREIRYRSESEKTDPNKILGILCKVFGDSNPATLSKEDFFARNQRERETLLMYSQALLYLAERMIKKDTTLEASRQTLLKGKFIEGLREDSIRRELRKIDMYDKELTFSDFRDKVIKLVGDDLKHKATLVRETRAQTETDGKYTSLTKMISDQQKQITELTSLFSQMAHKSQYKRGINNKGEKVCFYCKEISHFKKDCSPWVAPRIGGRRDPGG